MKNSNENQQRVAVLNESKIGRRLSRRAWLKTAFACAALPTLDAFMPVKASAQQSNKNFVS